MKDMIQNIIQNALYIFLVVIIYLLLAETSFAQDATKMDSKHYKIEFENEYVRVLRITYAAGEKSIMHEHPNAVIVMLTDSKTKFTLPNGKTVMSSSKKGETSWAPATKHLPQNISDKPMEAILIEMKTTLQPKIETDAKRQPQP